MAARTQALRCGAWAAVLWLGGAAAVVAAEAATHPSLDERFTTSVVPFLENYCLDCHAGAAAEASLDLSRFGSTEEVVAEFGLWEIVLDRVAAGEMPPEEASEFPEDDARAGFVDWSRELRRIEAEKQAGDPGPVFARRLSNAEYDYSMRDLTGVDIRPGKEFPIDPGNEAGFDNSGESLATTPALLAKYLDAARSVADHLVLKPDGFDFAPHPVVVETDRDKYAVRRIIDFYERQNVQLADYFLAAWKHKHRTESDDQDAAIRRLARQNGLSPRYLSTICRILSGDDPAVGPLAEIRERFAALPSPAADDEAAVLAACEQLKDWVVDTRAEVAYEFPHLRVRGMNAGSQPLVLWRNRQKATHRLDFDREKLPSQAPGVDESALEDSYARFCETFPDAFYISERVREFRDPDEKDLVNEKGRLLSAGFHSMMGYFRDDAPLYELLLDETQQTDLDRLWRELDFVADAPLRQHQGFIWFERTDSRFMISEEFDFARAEDKDAASEEKIARLAEVYLAKALRNGAGEVEAQAIRDHYRIAKENIRWVEQARAAAEPAHLAALVDFAERAFRRPLSDEQRADVLGFYHALRETTGLDHEAALRDSIVYVLMSPQFGFRLDLAARRPGVQPLDDYELASRLSYFLWSSLPDRELLDVAAAGMLHEPEVLRAQTRRMLRDDRVRALAVEFGGAWLDFRRFEEHNAVDRLRFPTFDDELRAAMFEEPVRFLVDVLQSDGSLLDLLYADHTFVDGLLAKHYGAEVELAPGEWARLENAGRLGRGGLPTMAVFLTKNAPGLRTSPVKRGYWVVNNLLGERIPPPPPTVPELPADEASLGDLTLREALAKHREHSSCSGCHARFDSLGVVFEGYGPVGERRTLDLGGRPIDDWAEFPNGDDGAGAVGLRDYLRSTREADFIDNFSRLLVSYALGRTLILPDDPLLADVREGLAADGHRIGSAIETIVLSPQFLTKRGDDLASTE